MAPRHDRWRWATEHGLVGREVAARWETLLRVYYLRYERRELTFQEQRRAGVREFLGIEASDGEVDELFASYQERYEAAWAAFDDATPALRHVRHLGLGTAVLTNGEDQSPTRSRTGTSSPPSTPSPA